MWPQFKAVRASERSVYSKYIFGHGSIECAVQDRSDNLEQRNECGSFSGQFALVQPRCGARRGPPQCQSIAPIPKSPPPVPRHSPGSQKAVPMEAIKLDTMAMAVNCLMPICFTRKLPTTFETMPTTPKRARKFEKVLVVESHSFRAKICKKSPMNMGSDMSMSRMPSIRTSGP